MTEQSKSTIELLTDQVKALELRLQQKEPRLMADYLQARKALDAAVIAAANVAVTPNPGGRTPEQREIISLEFAGYIDALDAVVHLLRRSGKPVQQEEIIRRVVEGGWSKDAKFPSRDVKVSISQNSKPGRPLVRRDGWVGLAEWDEPKN